MDYTRDELVGAVYELYTNRGCELPNVPNNATPSVLLSQVKFQAQFALNVKEGKVIYSRPNYEDQTWCIFLQNDESLADYLWKLNVTACMQGKKLWMEWPQWDHWLVDQPAGENGAEMVMSCVHRI